MIFLSYACEDKKIVEKIYEGLKKRELEVWFDKEKKKPGKWKKRIEKAIAKSRYFIFCISEASLIKINSKDSSIVDNELQIAWEFTRDHEENVFSIVPVRIEDCERGDLRLSGWEQYDLFKNFEHELDRLSIDLGGISLSDAQAKDNRSNDKKINESLLGKIYLAILSRKFSTALILVDILIEFDQNNIEFLNLKAGSLFYSGRFNDSLVAFKKVTELFPKSAHSWFNLGTTFQLGFNNYTAAIEAYEKALLLDINDHQAWNNKAISHFNLKQFDEAIKSYEATLKLNPSNYLAIVGIGNSKFFKNMSKENSVELGIEEYDKAIKYDPKRFEAWHCKGMAFVKLQKIPEAIRCLKMALDLVKKNIGENNSLFLGISQDINLLETHKDNK